MASHPTPELTEIAPAEAHQLVTRGAMLLDVREPDEWAAGHAPEATHVPMEQVTAQRAALPPDRRIVAVCRSGGRSGKVTEALTSWGFDAVNLAGGMQAWAAAGFEVVADDGAPGTVV